MAKRHGGIGGTAINQRASLSFRRFAADTRFQAELTMKRKRRESGLQCHRRKAVIRMLKVICLLVALGLPLGGRALAQSYSDVARNTGYRDGLEKGRNDARQGASFNLERHDAYRDADHGYRSSFGNKEDYRRQYREAFRLGYEEGYRGRPDRWAGQEPPEERTGRRGAAYSEVAENTGYRDGLEKGRNDARQGASFNLERHDAYRDADHGYRSSFGNKEEYKQQYRDAFRRGYQEGYRRRNR